jgi:Uma2 family endonuclease
LIIGLLLRRESQRKFRVLTEQRLRVSGQKHVYRIPDVCVMALPYRRQPVLSTPPHLAIEIVSPDDETADLLAKLADYLRFGIPHIWIPDPYKRTLQQADRDGLRPCPGLVVETDLVGQVDFNELFAQLDEPTE